LNKIIIIMLNYKMINQKKLLSCISIVYLPI